MRCLEMDLTADRSAPPYARGAVPAYYLDRSSVRERACLNAPPKQSMQWWKNTPVDAPQLERGNHDLERSENHRSRRRDGNQHVRVRVKQNVTCFSLPPSRTNHLDGGSEARDHSAETYPTAHDRFAHLCVTNLRGRAAAG